jgi:hypothetical protein
MSQDELQKRLASRGKSGEPKEEKGTEEKKEGKTLLSSLWRNIASDAEERKRENSWFAQYIMGAIMTRQKNEMDKKTATIELLEGKGAVPWNTRSLPAVKLIYALLFSDLPVLNDLSTSSLLDIVLPIPSASSAEPLSNPKDVTLLYLSSFFQAFQIQDSFLKISSANTFTLLDGRDTCGKGFDIAKIWPIRTARYALSCFSCVGKKVRYRYPILDWLVTKKTHLFPWLDSVLELWINLESFKPFTYQFFSNMIKQEICGGDVQRQLKTVEFLTRTAPVLLFDMLYSYLEIYETLYSLWVELYRNVYRPAETAFLSSLETSPAFPLSPWRTVEDVASLTPIEQKDVEAKAKIPAWFQDLYSEFQTNTYSVLDLVPLLTRPREEENLINAALSRIRSVQSQPIPAPDILLTDVKSFNFRAETILKIAEVIHYNLQEVGPNFILPKREGDPILQQYGKPSFLWLQGVEALQTIGLSLRIMIKNTMEYTGIIEREETKGVGFLTERFGRIRLAIFDYDYLLMNPFYSYMIQVKQLFPEVKIQIPGSLEWETTSGQWSGLSTQAHSLMDSVSSIKERYNHSIYPLRRLHSCVKVLHNFRFYFIFDLILNLTIDLIEIFYHFTSVYEVYISYRHELKTEDDLRKSLGSSFRSLFQITTRYQEFEGTFIHSLPPSKNFYIVSRLFQLFIESVVPFWPFMEELYAHLILNLTQPVLSPNDLQNTKLAFSKVRAYNHIYYAESLP